MKCEETLDIKADAKQYSGQSSDPCRDTERIMRLKLEAEGRLIAGCLCNLLHYNLGFANSVLCHSRVIMSSVWI